MSWSFYAQGKPATVAAAAKAAREQSQCTGAEEVARTAVLEAVEVLALDGSHGPCAIKVEASGSAYTQDGVQTRNQLTLKVETISAE